MKIITNNVPRLLKYGYEMPDKFKAEFDYINEEEFDSHNFFVYKGEWYDLNEFMRVTDTMENCHGFKGWDGYMYYSFFSGILIKLVQGDSVIVGQYFSY